MKLENNILKNIIIIFAMCLLLCPFTTLFAREPEREDYSGRTELIVGQSINGAVMGGTLFMGLVGDDDVISSMTPFAGAFAGAGIGLHSSYVLSRKEPYVSGEQAAFIHSASFWSAFEGLMLGIIISPKTEKPWLMSALSNAGGTMAACHLAYPSPPHKNQIAMVDAAGLWGALLGFETYFLLSDRLRGRSLAGFVFFGSSLGLGLASWWEQNDQFSPGLVGKISGSGLLGGLVGVSVMTLPLVCGGARSRNWDELLLTGAIIGSITGIILGYRKYKDEREDVSGKNPSGTKRSSSEHITYFTIPAGGSW